MGIHRNWTMTIVNSMETSWDKSDCGFLILQYCWRQVSYQKSTWRKIDDSNPTVKLKNLFTVFEFRIHFAKFFSWNVCNVHTHTCWNHCMYIVQNWAKKKTRLWHSLWTIILIKNVYGICTDMKSTKMHPLKFQCCI